MTNYINRTQSGRSMIEMLGVLAIVGILSAGGIAGYSMAMQSYKTSALTEKVQLLAQQTRVLYDGDYTGATVGTASTGLIGAGLINDAKNAFGGDLTIASADSNKAFTITTEANTVPSEACVKLMRADWGNTGVFVSISSGTKTACSAGASGEGQSGCDYASPVPAGDAITACQNGNKTMTWTFK